MRVRTRSDLLDPWLVVERQSAGLLRYARARGTVALPVHYATSQHRIYLRLPIFNDACNFIDRADLAMDVRGSTVGRMSVTRIAGVGLLVPDTGVPTDLTDTLEAAWGGVATRAIALVPESVRQFHFVDDLRYPPLEDQRARLPGTFTDMGDAIGSPASTRDAVVIATKASDRAERT